jgi:hypothetical protein
MNVMAPPGTIDSNLQRELTRSEAFWPWVTVNLHGVDFPKNRRNVFAMAMFQVAYDHQATIVLAVKAVRFASALALVRPLCEATLMGMWILHAADDNVLEALAHARYAPPPIDDLVKALDRKAFFDRPMHQDMGSALKRMHSFTHGGVLHIAPRYQGVRVGANYAVKDVIWALQTADVFATLAALEAAQTAGDDAKAAAMFRHAREWLDVRA